MSLLFIYIGYTHYKIKLFRIINLFNIVQLVRINFSRFANQLSRTPETTNASQKKLCMLNIAPGVAAPEQGFLPVRRTYCFFSFLRLFSSILRYSLLRVYSLHRHRLVCQLNNRSSLTKLTWSKTSDEIPLPLLGGRCYICFQFFSGGDLDRSPCFQPYLKEFSPSPVVVIYPNISYMSDSCLIA